MGSFKPVFTICACFYLWQNPNLRGAGNEIEEDLRKDSPALEPFVSFVLSLTLCLATRTCFSVARVSDVMNFYWWKAFVSELPCKYLIFFLYFFLTFSNKINDMRSFVFLYCVTKEIVKWRSSFKLMLEDFLAWGNRHHFETSPLVLPRSDNWGASPEFPLTFPLDLGSASSWLKICFKSNQKHYPDTGRDASLVRNLCALSRGN